MSGQWKWLWSGIALSAVVVVAPPRSSAADQIDPRDVAKFVEPLVIPPVMPPVKAAPTLTRYAIAVRQFEQQVLPSGYPRTTVWGYGNARGPDPGELGSTIHYPAFTVEGRSHQRVRVR